MKISNKSALKIVVNLFFRIYLVAHLKKYNLFYLDRLKLRTVSN